jgi:serine/threonine protein phosphatase 1
MNNIWVVGDVHGEYDKLVALIDKLPKNARICFVGDLIDRGKKSAYVLELVANSNYDCILGNHEIFMLEDNPMWYSNYGKKTIRSYYSLGFDKRPKHFQYLRKLPYFKYYEFQDYKPLVVSHSYIHDIWRGKEFAYNEKDLDDMTWKHMTEKGQFDKKREIENGIFNIFGHTPLDEVVMTDTYAMIDTGACFKDGKLSAMCYPTLEVVEV